MASDTNFGAASYVPFERRTQAMEGYMGIAKHHISRDLDLSNLARGILLKAKVLEECERHGHVSDTGEDIAEAEAIAKELDAEDGLRGFSLSEVIEAIHRERDAAWEDCTRCGADAAS